MATIALNKTAVKSKAVTAALAVAAAVLLPQLFHAVGAVSGTGAVLGAAFLPMHLPVLLAGLLGGPLAGLVAGAASPLISFLLTGLWGANMPGIAVLPFMVLELAGYGLAGGLLCKRKLPVFVKLLIAQAAGRLVRAIAVLVAVYGFGSETVQVAGIWNMVTAGLPGIILQWALIPLLLYRMKGLQKYYA